MTLENFRIADNMLIITYFSFLVIAVIAAILRFEIEPGPRPETELNADQSEMQNAINLERFAF